MRTRQVSIKAFIDKLESRVAGILARQVIGFGVWGYRSSTVWPVERVLSNRFRLSLYGLVSIGVVIAA